MSGNNPEQEHGHYQSQTLFHNLTPPTPNAKLSIHLLQRKNLQPRLLHPEAPLVHVIPGVLSIPAQRYSAVPLGGSTSHPLK